MGWEKLQALAVVPLSVALVAIIAFAFKADANATAAFFGSFMAAIVAALSAFAGWIYQSRNVVAVERRARNERAVFIYGYMLYARRHLERAGEMLGRATFNIPNGAEPTDADLTNLRVKGFRKVITPLPSLETNRLLEFSLAYPSELALAAMQEIDQTQLESVVWRFEIYDEEKQLTREQINNTTARLAGRIVALTGVINLLRDDLNKRSVIVS